MTSPGFLGSDPVKLRALGGMMTTNAQALTQIRTATSKQVQALDWHGKDRTDFLGQWTSSYAPALDRVAQALQAASKHLNGQAAQQEQASGARGGADTGAAAGPAGTPVTSGGGGGGGTPPTTAADVDQGGPGDPQAGQPAGSGAAPAYAPQAADAQGPAGTQGAGAAGAGAPSQSAQDPVIAKYGNPTGDLSAAFEGKVDTVSNGKSWGDPGGTSYGKFQITTGTMPDFVKWAKVNEPETYAKLAGLKVDSAGFNQAWQELARSDREGFGRQQWEFIRDTHYRHFVDHTASKAPGFSMEGRSPVVAEVVWSTAVQHGPNSNVVANALRGHDVSSMSDAELIRRIYDERGAGNGTKYFNENRISAKALANIVQRFKTEKARAIGALDD